VSVHEALEPERVVERSGLGLLTAEHGSRSSSGRCTSANASNATKASYKKAQA